MHLAPVLLLVYNRPDHLSKTLQALQANTLAHQTHLFIYSDAPRSSKDQVAVEQVRALLIQVEGFAQLTVVERTENWGLAANVIDGVTTLTNQFGRVIVLEDDLITSPFFLQFMNEALDQYQDVEEVMNVQAHVLKTKQTLPYTFFIRFANSWGWATWQRAWQKFNPNGQELLDQLEASQQTHRFDFDGRYPFTRMLRRQIAGENHSWAIRWNASIFLNKGLALNAGRSLVLNIGTDGSGTNFTKEAGFYTELYDENTPLPIIPNLPLEENEMARQAIGKIFAYEYSKITKGIRLLRSYFRRLKNRIV